VELDRRAALRTQRLAAMTIMMRKRAPNDPAPIGKPRSVLAVCPDQPGTTGDQFEDSP
jgi:hypothetical protein